MQVKLSDVIDGIDKTSIDKQYYYYIDEERVIEKDDDVDINRLIPLPSNAEIDNYGTMLLFIDDLNDEEVKGWLQEAVKGAGAFKRFRTVLERFNITDDWLDYLDAVHEDIAIKWCEYHGIEYLDDELFKKEEEKEIKSNVEVNNYKMININEDNIYGLVYLVIEFRKYLAKLKNNISDYDEDDALDELRSYLALDNQIKAISLKGKNIAYAVYKIYENVVWLESLFVLPEYRLKGVGKMLLEKGEEIAKEYHNDTLYMYVHPNNDLMLDFLNKNGYNVLNLIEIRKKYPNEKLDTTYSIGNHDYKY